MWLGVLLLPRVFTLSIGCGPKDGNEGGACIESNSCNQGNYCNGNLVCSGNTCVQPGPTPPTSSAPGDACDVLLSRSPCADPNAAVCRGTTKPDPAWNGACAATLGDDEGDTVFCCDTSRPMCWAPWGDQTDPGPADDNLVWSDCPGGSFSCHDLAVPPLDASLECAQDLPDDAGFTSLCCVSGSACFELTPQGWDPPDAYYPQGQCAPGENEFFCTGTASLASASCRTIDAGSAPTQAPAFCCPADSPPTVSYGEAGADL